jgi:Nucleotidyltransferase/DNA polymerase involved in DNA repair
MVRSFTAKGNAQGPADKSVQEILTILHKWGIHTLGQFAALDREQLGARLGPEAIRMWERANGQSDRMLKLIPPPELFEESFEFENEIETAEPLLFMLRRFLEQFAIQLSGIYLVTKELTLRITFTNKQIYERIFKIPQPTNNVDLLFRMLHTHLENFKSKYPIVAVALNAQPIKPAREQFGLFETTLRNPHQLSETLARLTALLGADHVGTPVLEETHRADAFRMEPFLWNWTSTGGNGGRSSATPGTHPKAPGSSPLHTSGLALRRFRPAPSASVLLHEDRPAHIRGADVGGKIIDLRGPYLISGNWWDEKSWTHAEWDLQLDAGELVRCHESEATWRIDGIYD